jgi:S-adenosylmethionine uptake transporter
MNAKTIKWINSKGHFQGIFWIICASLFSTLGDTSIRLVSNNLPAMQITFFRLFFGTMILLPLLLYKGKSAFIIKNKSWHTLRIIIGFGAIACWIYGASQTSLPSITTISFVCPLLVLPLAYLFLGEKSDWKRLLVVGMGFVGVIIIAFFEKGATDTGSMFFHTGIVFLFLGAVLFAMSDVLNKKMLASENLFSLLFYFYLGTTLISFIPALMVWKQMNYNSIFYLLVQGAGGISMLYCILKAAAATEISSMAPYKYIELVFSIAIGYLLFNEVIKISTIIGASLIIPGALVIAYYEINKERNDLQTAPIESEP